MEIYKDGKKKSIPTNDSRTRSVIARYFNTVRRVEKGDKKALKNFKPKTVRDSRGKIHRLDTNPDRVLTIKEKKENAEFHEGIY